MPPLPPLTTEHDRHGLRFRCSCDWAPPCHGGTSSTTGTLALWPGQGPQRALASHLRFISPFLFASGVGGVGLS